MYLRANEGSATIGKAPAPPRLHPRCHRLALTVPGSYAALEEAVRRWISTCVSIRRERGLVTANPSLRSTWNRVFQHMKGQRVDIVAEYVWGPNRVESINFSTPNPPPPPPRRCLPVAEASRIEREATKKTLHKAAEVARRFVTTVGAVPRGRFTPTVLDTKYWFAKLYELTTYYEIEAEKRFRYPAFVFHFIPVFHGMYVDALENFGRGNLAAVHPLWLQHFRATGRPDVNSLIGGVQTSIVTGTAAHVQGDMATALTRAYRSYVGRYCLPNPPFDTFRADFENMQPIFARSQAAFFLELSHRFGDFRFSPEVLQLIMGIGARYVGGLDLDEVLRWRAAAWSEAAKSLP